MIGKTISHYKILERIGGGGMGVVYKAEDTKLKRLVALKFLPPAFATDPTTKERFIHEAQSASALQHNNICAIHEIDESDDGQMFIVMDYYKGQTIKEKLESGKIDLDTAIDYTIQIAQGLQEAHQRGIIHRDIKPANIIVTNKGEAKTLDFGLAKFRGQTKITKTGSTLGTVAYMSPEQAKGDEVDQRTDIWSLGVMLYEMVTGELPFKGDYDQALVYSILNEEPTPLETESPDVLKLIIDKCLEKNPSDRYQDVGELIVDLTGLKDGSSSLQIGKIGTKIRLKPILLIASALLVILLVVVGYLYISTGDLEKTSKGVIEWENSIAVLPFADLSPDKDQEYFCDGMTEQIITNLSKIKRLKVIARTSVTTYKNTNKQIPEIGKELNVTHLVEGSIRKYGNSIRVTAQLINTEDGSHIWADDYDRELEHVFEVQDDVSEAIASNLLEKLSFEDLTKIKTKRPINPDAYEYYLMGSHIHEYNFLAFAREEDFIKSETAFKKAIKLDPNYADAYAALAGLYNTGYFYLANTKEETEKYLQLQEAYLDTAFNLDSTSAEVYFVKHMVHGAKAVYYALNGEYDKAVHEDNEQFKCIKNTIEINPNLSGLHREVGIFLAFNDLLKLSIKYFKRGTELDPNVLDLYSFLGSVYFVLGEYDKAETHYQKVLEIEPNHFQSLGRYYLFILERKKYDEAEELLIHMEEVISEPNKKYLDWYKALFYASQGEKEKALAACKHKSPETFSLLGMKEEAINILIRRSEIPIAIDERESYHSLNNHSFWDNIRDDPRFQQLLAKYKERYEENLRKYGDLDI
jgi:serine/threonine protein kinase/Flp pilus assembly protein TadD